jgi:hypothetical protein
MLVKNELYWMFDRVLLRCDLESCRRTFFRRLTRITAQHDFCSGRCLSQFRFEQHKAKTR